MDYEFILILLILALPVIASIYVRLTYNKNIKNLLVQHYSYYVVG